jgi:signal peptidase I
MEPTLDPGDQLVVDHLSRHFRAPQPRDVVVLREPGSGDLVVKRVVAEAGQWVAIGDGVLVVTACSATSPMPTSVGVDAFFFGPNTVPDETVFVLGDNRVSRTTRPTTGRSRSTGWWRGCSGTPERSGRSGAIPG